MLFTLLLLCVVLITNVLAAQDCEVCQRVLDQIYETLSDDDKKDMLVIEDKILQFCKKQEKGEGRRVCYSIETLKRQVSKPMMNSVPSEVLCKRLAKRDYEICRIAEGGGIKKIDLSTIDPDTMRLRQLKKVLSENGLKCTGCVERREFVNLVKRELLKQDVKEEL
mmetsp:Transcript_17599/g.30798  ORF Transcript_17599/g.30798 Transcript_17599/m.30798 type:complete len:166 (+) Transcript_17599:28-525(+)